jgi:hypothetical protein
MRTNRPRQQPSRRERPTALTSALMVTLAASAIAVSSGLAQAQPAPGDSTQIPRIPQGSIITTGTADQNTHQDHRANRKPRIWPVPRREPPAAGIVDPDFQKRIDEILNRKPPPNRPSVRHPVTVALQA